MGGACSTNGGEDRCIECHWENLIEEDHLEDPGVTERIILKRILKKWDGGDMDWIELALDRDRCRAVVSAVMNLRVP